MFLKYALTAGNLCFIDIKLWRNIKKTANSLKQMSFIIIFNQADDSVKIKGHLT